MISGKEEFFNLVEEGRKGNNIGLSIGSKKLETYMDGYLPGTSYLIGATSGTGKSTYALWALVYQPLMEYLRGENTERDPYWIMFNLEMTRSQVYAKLVSMYIFDQCKTELKFKKIFSRGKDCMLNDEEYKILQEHSSFLDELDKRLFCYNGFLTEKVYVETVKAVIDNFGTWTDDGEFTPNNPNQILGVMIDHCSLIKASTSNKKKDEMDAISRDSVMFRNVCKIVSPIHIAQFNRNSGSEERIKKDIQDPDQTDFKDSGALYDDSQVVLALFSPLKYKLNRWKEYDAKTLGQSLIFVYLLKSRFGNSDIAVPFGFYGDCSHYVELPRANEIYDFGKYATSDWLKIDEDEIDRELSDESRPKLNGVSYNL